MTCDPKKQEWPLSEQFRIIGKKWVDADDAARMYEETKSAVLAKKKKDLGDMPDNRAETEVKASEEWLEFVTNGVKARTKASLLKIQLEYIRVKIFEATNDDANKRHELRLTR